MKLPTGSKKSTLIRFSLMLLGVLILVITFLAISTYPAKKVETTSRENSFSNEGDKAVVDPVLCDNELNKLASAGLILYRPAPDRVHVDEQKWAAIPVGNQRLIASAVRCSFLRGYLHRNGPDDYIEIYGHQTDKLLAEANVRGVFIP